MQFSSRLLVRPEPIAGSHRPIDDGRDPVRLAAGLERHRALNVIQARYAARWVVIGAGRSCEACCRQDGKEKCCKSNSNVPHGLALLSCIGTRMPRRSREPGPKFHELVRTAKLTPISY